MLLCSSNTIFMNRKILYISAHRLSTLYIYIHICVFIYTCMCIYTHVCVYIMIIIYHINCYLSLLSAICISPIKGGILIDCCNWQIKLSAEMTTHKINVTYEVFMSWEFYIYCQSKCCLPTFQGKLFIRNMQWCAEIASIAFAFSHFNMGVLSYHWKWSKVWLNWLDLIFSCS